MAVTAAELLVLVRAEGVEATAASLLGLGEATSAAAMGATALAAAAALTVAGLAASTVEAANFQRMTTEIANNTTMATGQIDTMRQTILALGADSGVSFDILGQGFMRAMNITNDTAASMAILTVATESAASTGGNAAATTNILANAMHEYGLDLVTAADGTLNLAAVQANAAHVMGVMHLAAAEGNMTLEQFSEYSGRSIGIAANLGVSLEDVSAGFSALTRHGFDAATAGTQMTNILTHLINPTKSAKDELIKLSNATGVDLVADFSAAGLSSKGFEGVLGDLRTAYQKMGYSSAEAEAESMKLIAAQRGGLGLATLLGTGYEDFTKTLADLNNQELTNGITEQSYNKIRETAGFQWDRLKRTVQEAAIVLGTSMLPALTGVLGGLQAAVQGAIPFIQTYGPQLASALGSGLAAVISFGSGIASAIGAVLGAFRALVTGQISLAEFIGGMQIMVSTVGATLGRLAAIAIPAMATFFGAIGSAISRHGPGIMAQFAAWGGQMSAWITTTAIPFLMPRLAAFAEGFVGWITGSFIPAMVGFYGRLGLGLTAWITTTAIPAARAKFAEWGTAIDAYLNGTFAPALAAKATALSAALTNWITTTAIPAVRAQLSTWGTSINEWLNGTFAPAVQKATSDAWERVKTATGAKFSELGMAVRDKLTEIKNDVGDKFSELGTAAHEKLTALKNAVGDRFSEMGTAVRDKLTEIKNDVGDRFSEMGTAAHDKLTDLKKEVGDRFSEAGTAVHDKIDAIKKDVGDTFDAIGTAVHVKIEAVKTAIIGAWDAIPAPVRADLKAISDDVDKIFSGIGTLIDQKMTAIGKAISTAWDGAAKAVSGKNAEMQKDTDDKFAAMSTTVETKTTAMSLSTQTNLNAMNDGAVRNLDAMAKAVGDKFGEMATTADTKLNAMNDAMATKLDSMATAATTKFTEIADAAKNTLGPMAEETGKKFDDMSAAMVKSLEAMAKAAGDKLGEIVTAIRTKLTEAVGVVTGYASQFESAGATIINALADGIGRAMGAAISKVREGLDKIAGMLPHSEPQDPSSPLRGLVQSGASVFEMFGAGIAQGAPAAVNAIANGARAVLDTARDALGIQSPSKGFTFVGAMAMQGFGDGFLFVGGVVKKSVHENMMGMLTDAETIANKIANAIASAASISANQITAGGAIRGGDSGELPRSWGGGQAAGAALGTGVAAGAREALQIQSPSQVMATIGQQVVAGLVQGMGATQQDAAKKAAEVAKAVADAVLVTLTALRALGNLNGAALPSGEQLGGFLTATMQVVNAVAAAAAAMNGKALEAAVKLAEGAGKVLGFVGSAVTALTGLATAVLPSTAAIYGLGKLLQATVNDFAVMAEAVGTEMLGSAVEFATGAGAVAEAVGKGVAGLAKLADFVTPSAAAIYALDKALRLAIQDFAALAELVGKDMLAQAVVLAEGAGKVAEAVGKGVAGLAKLADFVAPPAAAIYAFGKTIRLLVADFAAIGDLVGNDALTAAGKFAEGAGKTTAIIAASVTGLMALGTFVAPLPQVMGSFIASLTLFTATLARNIPGLSATQLAAATAFAETAGKVTAIIAGGVTGLMALRGFVAPLPEVMGSFINSLNLFGATFVVWAPQFATGQLTAATLFAETAGKVAAIIAGGVTGLTALRGFVAPSNDAIAEFVRVLTDITSRLAYYMPTFAAGQLAAAQLFAETAGKVTAIIAGGVAGFNALAGFTAPSNTAIAAFVASVTEIVGRVTGVARYFSTDGLAAAGQFADAAGKVLATIGTGVTGLTALFAFVAPSTNALDAFAASVQGMVARFGWLAMTLSGPGLTAATTFATAAGAVFGALTSATGFFKSLDNLLLPDLAGINRILAPITATIDAVLGVAARFGTAGLTAAQQFATTVGAIFGAMQTATTALGRPSGTGGLGLPATGGGGSGGGGGLTVNLTFNAPILGVADFNNAVVAAVVEAERRGRL